MNCNHCGKKVSKPIFDIVDGKKKINWKNLCYMPLTDWLFFISILLIVAGFVHDTGWCKEVQEHPCTYCEKTGCCSQPLNCYPNATKSSPNYPNYEIPSDLKIP